MHFFYFCTKYTGFCIVSDIYIVNIIVYGFRWDFGDTFE
jgi:hypothetical protein